MPILINSQYFWPEDFRAKGLARIPCARGHGVVVDTGNPDFPAGRFLPAYGFSVASRVSFRRVGSFHAVVNEKPPLILLREKLDRQPRERSARLCRAVHCFAASRNPPTSPRTGLVDAMSCKFKRKTPREFISLYE
jgi:hypothetical protein